MLTLMTQSLIEVGGSVVKPSVNIDRILHPYPTDWQSHNMDIDRLFKVHQTRAYPRNY